MRNLWHTARARSGSCLAASVDIGREGEMRLLTNFVVELRLCVDGRMSEKRQRDEESDGLQHVESNVESVTQWKSLRVARERCGLKRLEKVAFRKSDATFEGGWSPPLFNKAVNSECRLNQWGL
jgi:hypothetical protein